MKKPEILPTGHPNRLATCPVCGDQMPRRFLAGHQKKHAPAGEETPGDSASGPKPERGGTLLCPACGQFVLEADFAAHMTDNHATWCPLCRTLPSDLLDHLKRSHHVKPLQPSPGFGHGWQTQARFVCLWCKKNISVWSYPKHAQPHGQRENPSDTSTQRK
jgi:hypothetical protein